MTDDVEKYFNIGLEKGDLFLYSFTYAENQEVNITSKVLEYGTEEGDDFLENLCLLNFSFLLVPTEYGVDVLPVYLIERGVSSLVRLGEEDKWMHSIIQLLSEHDLDEDSLNLKQIEKYKRMDWSPEKVVAHIVNG